MHSCRDRTRIFVPEACLLMGVVDEWNVLEEGQVFVQIDCSPLLDDPEVIESTVCVTKNPCFHPGDIRVLQVQHRPGKIGIFEHGFLNYLNQDVQLAM